MWKTGWLLWVFVRYGYVFDVIVARTVCPPFSEQIWPNNHCINE